jgi:hypothetical protein
MLNFHVAIAKLEAIGLRAISPLVGLPASWRAKH